ncbi:OmpA family protein [Hahella sp. CCB-MM4]|uniref:flagellar protein MotY n=1 Tax=Hahella sp. (strain CCB-MM4) TaxID=1926491 RepID=UPI000B9A50BC|nr:OmpA family protein [Hahella sp. CCB-MM4]
MPSRKIYLPALVFSLAMYAAGWAQATMTFSAGIEQSQWYLSSSIFECSLTHNIPRYGRAVFFHEAGEPLKFYLSTARNPMRKGQAALVLEAPGWRPGSMVTDLGYVAVAEQTQPITIGQSKASQMMDSLLQGMMPTFTRKARFGNETVRVEVSSINFSQFYEDYLTCVAALLPVNFRQVERTAVFFRVDEATLSEADSQALDQVILYVKADPSVTAVFVDGHTDVTGRRIYNRRLSKDRAEAVTSYLIANGLSPDMITTRYHGERYPVVDNRKPESLARNRRTTVRLERGTKPPKVDDSVLDITEEGSF